MVLRVRLGIFGRLSLGLGSAADGDTTLVRCHLFISLASYNDDETTEIYRRNHTLLPVYVRSDRVIFDNWYPHSITAKG